MGKSIDWKQVIRYAGAIIAFGIGSGFATGQEVMQFFTAYGFKSILTCVVFLVIIIYANCSFAAAGYYEKLQKGSKVYEFYGGPIIGKFFDYFTVLFCYMSFVVMVSGASATFAQQFGFPKLVGGVVIAVLAGIAVVFGLNSLVDVISKIGPVIIVFTVFIAVTALVLTGSHLSEGAALLESGEIEILKGGSNWFTAGISYAGSR